MYQTTFDDGPDRRLFQMTICSDQFVNSITFDYIDPIRERPPVTHGDPVGCTNRTIGFSGLGEHIVSIKGKFGEYNTGIYSPDSPPCEDGTAYDWRWIMGQMVITTNLGNVHPDPVRDGISVYGTFTSKCSSGVAGPNTPFELNGNATGGFFGATSSVRSDYPQSTSALGWYSRI